MSSSLSLFRVLHLTSSFAVEIIATVTGDNCLTTHVNTGHNKLLSKLTYKVVFLMRMGRQADPYVTFESSTADSA